jgi:hypothetical protein
MTVRCRVYVPRDRSKRFWASILHFSAPDLGAGWFIGSGDQVTHSLSLYLGLTAVLTIFGFDKLQFVWSILFTLLGLGQIPCT